MRAALRDLRARASELEDIEVKSARGGVPQGLWTTISAFANRDSGGMLLFGLEPGTFRPSGIADLDALQVRLSATAAEMEPPLGLHMLLIYEDERPVLAVEVPAVPPSQRPCFHRPDGMYGGAYVRVGDADRRMSDYEIHLYMAGRGHPVDDRKPVDGTSMGDLDPAQLDAALGRLRERRPQLATLASDRTELLRMINVLADDGSRLTLAGLLLLGRYPQHYFPNLVITVAAYPTEPDPPEARFDFNVKCEGSFQAMLESAILALNRLMKRRVVVRGLLNEEIPEYPGAALREILANALIHRDYSHFALGTQVQVRVHPGTLVVQSPGGLYGPVTVDQLGDWGVQSTRNPVIASIAEDVGLMENRGTGLQSILREMRRAHLAPPEWRDTRVSFRVTLSSSNLLDQPTLDWLGRFADVTLNDAQRYALAYLRHHTQLANRDYRRLNNTDAQTALRDLQDLVEAGVVRAVGRRGATTYELTNGAREQHRLPVSDTRASAVLGLLRESEPRTAAAIGEATGWSKAVVLAAIRELMEGGLVEATTAATHSRNRAYRLRNQKLP